MGAPRRPLAERSSAPPADPYEAARAIALRSLAQGPRTRQQLAQTLARRGVDEAVAEALLDRLEAVELLDDAAYARDWVRSRHDGRGLSRRALGQELRHRGVSEDATDAALAGLDSRAEEQRARDLVDAKLAASRGLEVAVRTRRLVGMLARKGYPPGLATRVVREQLALEPDVDAPGRRFLDALDGPLSELAELGE